MGRVKKKEFENLTSTNISKVNGLLTASKPITKKEACQLLNITYNTTRLGKIISEWKEKEAFVALRKLQNRGKPATKTEISQIVEDCLSGVAISETAQGLFRSAGFVKAISDRLGIPRRPSNVEERAKIGEIPENCRSEIFKPKEIVWSAKYHRTAIIKKEYANLDYEYLYGSKCYLISVTEPEGSFYAYALAYDLGKLSHIL